MAAWTELTFPYNSFLTATKLTNMFDNLYALAEGTANAPKILTAAIDSLAITTPKLGAAAVAEEKAAVPVRFPSGTKWFFAQAAAPPGWTQVTSQNDKLLRVVSGAGGGTGGTWDRGVTLSAGEHPHSTNSQGLHRHTYGASGGEWGTGVSFEYTDYQGEHAHTLLSTGGHTHNHINTNWRPAYLDIILCSKD